MTFIEYLQSEGYEDAEDVVDRAGHEKLEYFEKRYELQCEETGEEPEYN